MDAPRQINIAIALSWTVVVIETAERLWRISINPDANYYSRLYVILIGETLSSAGLVALFIYFASRRHNWARIALLLSTLGGWFLWLLYALTIADYAWWQLLFDGGLGAMELAAVILLFHGTAVLWYHSAPEG